MNTVSKTKKTLMIAVAVLAGVGGIYPLAVGLIAEQRFVVAVVLMAIAGAIPGALTAFVRPWEWGTKPCEGREPK